MKIIIIINIQRKLFLILTIIILLYFFNDEYQSDLVDIIGNIIERLICSKIDLSLQFFIIIFFITLIKIYILFNSVYRDFYYMILLLSSSSSTVLYCYIISTINNNNNIFYNFTQV